MKIAVLGGRGIPSIVTVLLLLVSFSMITYYDDDCHFVLAVQATEIHINNNHNDDVDSSNNQRNSIRRKLQQEGAIHIDTNNNNNPELANMNPGHNTPPGPTYIVPELLTECKPEKTSNMSTWHITDYNNKAAFITYNELSDFVDGPGLEKMKNENVNVEKSKKLRFAVCEFRPLTYYNHFPHAMQQLLRCFSWIMANPKLPRRILWPKGFFDNYFTDNLMHFLRRYYNLLLVHEYKDYYTSDMVHVKNTSLIKDDIELTDFVMLKDHAKIFQEVFVNHINNGLPINQTIGCTKEKRVPRISIINRTPTSKRNLMNDVELRDAIKNAFPSYEVTITYFEKIEYDEQLKVMMTSDIVISPHGAQLQHIMLMPAFQCSAVLEFFPPQYFNPDFYGSLSKTFGLKHSFFYMDNDLNGVMTPDASGTNTPYHKITSYEYKNYPMCLDIPEVLKAVTQLVNDWNQCCNKLLMM